jgi:hypothetical protein
VLGVERSTKLDTEVYYIVMTPNAKHVLKEHARFHEKSPGRESYLVFETGLSIGDQDAAYAELSEAGYVEQGDGVWSSGGRSRPTYRITAAGIEASKSK